MAIRATVSVASLKTSVSVKTESRLSTTLPIIKAAVQLELVKAGVYTELVRAGIHTTLIEAGVHYVTGNATDIWLELNSKNRVFFEEMALSDVQINLVHKVLKDTIQVIDNKTLAYGKGLLDSPRFTEVQLTEVGKYLKDNTNLSDAKAMAFAKTLVDVPVARDNHIYHIDKSAGEHVANIVDAEMCAFTKVLTDSYKITDEISTLGFFKNTQDEAEFTESETIDFVKFLFDNVNATDDIDGIASILDDQEMQYFKHTSDIVKLTDTFIRVLTFIRVYTDLMETSDKTVWDITKPLTDSTVFTDAQRFDFGKLLVDDPKVSDSLAIRMMLAPFVDGTVIADTAVLDAGKNFTDIDKGSLTDTGSLRSQGYADFSYFAEDYVGSSRTF